MVLRVLQINRLMTTIIELILPQMVDRSDMSIKYKTLITNYSLNTSLRNRHVFIERE